MNRPPAESRLLPVRITVIDPPTGVRFRVQRGRHELDEPSHITATAQSFDLTLRLGAPLADGRPNFLGEYAQGTPSDRFIYVNSGRHAGNPDSPWDRRAKVKLTGIDWPMIEELLAAPDELILEAKIAGTAKDGGPACATVPVVGGWKNESA